jgi:CheY-like chemotaxis protein
MRKFNCILLVDDDFASNYLTETVLQDMELTDHIHISKNGQEALHFVEQNCKANSSTCPELILLDINMPVMDGFEFLKEFEKIQANKQPTYVILLTTSTNNKDIEKAKHFNVMAYLEKPLTEEKLNQIIESNF